MLNQNDGLHFTMRQAQIVALAADSLTDKEIAARLGLSVHTVRTHFHRIYQENHIRNRVAAVRLWLRSRGLDEPA